MQKELDHCARQLGKLKIKEYEIYGTTRRSMLIQSRDFKTDSMIQSEDVGIAVRVLSKGRMGFSFTTSLDKQALESAVKTAIQTAVLMPVDKYQGLFSGDKTKLTPLLPIDTKGIGVSADKKTALAKELEKRVRSADKRVKAVRSAAFKQTETQTWLVRPKMKPVQDRSAVFSLSVACKADQGSESQMGYDFRFSRKYDALDLDAVAQQAALNATEHLGATRPKSIKTAAILRNNVVSELLEFLSASFSAEELDKGRSLLIGKNGQAVFSPLLTLTDDGIRADGLGSSRFDGEGVPSRINTLIENGVFRTTLTNIYYAQKMGLPLTASAVRSIKSPPTIGFSNLVLKPGKESLEALVKKVHRGVIITDLMGLHTANPVTGDFSLGASAIMIENGKLGGPLREFAVSGNILTLLSRCEAVGSDFRFFGTVGTPSLVVPEITLSGA